jgi:tetratricopeptide (TPR) repeat protein
MPSLYEDYMIRMINMALVAIAKILQLKAAGMYQEAQHLIDVNLEELLGLDAFMIKNLDDESLLSILRKQTELDQERMIVVAALFKEEGDILEQRGQSEESQRSYLRALLLYLEGGLAEEGARIDEVIEKVNFLGEKLHWETLPVESLFTLFQFYELGGQYRQAEKVLSRMEKVSEQKQELAAEFEDFYCRLLEKDDQQLSQGGFSREQVQHKLGLRRQQKRG